ncbi:hypothetical protein SAMN05421853_10121 [Roseivivax halotolerans]|uniref:Cell division and transport-associated protein TolA n=1 Tax=Roseivivax halotolerans TaxID=93684 RepID=A0A1I5UK51_9RHOB|nr:hypothetical protein [Roseivivax halotolerans]SFP95644.1 hypothetical protein SAMN05421853_10121 [Roseivivax halotolerans]
MTTGQIISGIGHGVLILWVLFGGLFRPNPDPVRVQDVSVLSEEDFAALSQPSAPPEAAEEIDAPPAPETEEAPPQQPTPESVRPPQARPEPTPEPEPETPPEPVQPTPPAEVTDSVPELPQPEPEPESTAPDVADTPTPEFAPRVAPDPVPQPEPDAQVAEDVQDSVSPDADSPDTAEVEEQEATQPEAATSEIVTEAEEPARAPDSSMRPQTRPNRPTPQPAPEPEPETQTAETSEPEPEPAPEPAPDPEPAPESPDGVEAALAEALGGGTTDPQPDLPTGPPLTGGERDALRVAVQRCWVVDVGSQAANVTVVVAMRMEQSGQVVSDSLRMIESSGGDNQAAQTAYQAARRAILRCQGDGFPLPPEKYAQWREIEMVFDPSGMRLR